MENTTSGKNLSDTKNSSPSALESRMSDGWLFDTDDDALSHENNVPAVAESPVVEPDMQVRKPTVSEPIGTPAYMPRFTEVTEGNTTQFVKSDNSEPSTEKKRSSRSPVRIEAKSASEILAEPEDVPGTEYISVARPIDDGGIVVNVSKPKPAPAEPVVQDDGESELRELIESEITSHAEEKPEKKEEIIKADRIPDPVEDVPAPIEKPKALVEDDALSVRAVKPRVLPTPPTKEERERKKDALVDRLLSLRIRLYAVALFAVFLVFFENAAFASIPLFEGFFDICGKIGYAYIELFCTAALFCLTLPENVRAFRLLLKKKITALAILPVSFVLLLITDLCGILFFGGEVPLVGFAYSVDCVLILLAQIICIKEDLSVFVKIMKAGTGWTCETCFTRDHEEVHLAVNGVIDAFRSRYATVTEGYIYEGDLGEEGSTDKAHPAVLYSALACVAVAFIFSVIFGSVEKHVTLSVFSVCALMLFILPGAFSLSGALRYRRINRRAKEYDGFFAGYSGTEECAPADVIRVEDKEAFGEMNVTMKKMFLYVGREQVTAVLRQMSSLFASAKGPLGDLFARTADISPKAAILLSMEEDGVCGLVEGKTVRAGSFAYMKRHGFISATQTEEGNGETVWMYSTCDDHITAKFALHYALDPKFSDLLPLMREFGTVPLVVTTDPIVTNSLLASLCPDNCVIRVYKPQSHKGAEPEMKSCGLIGTSGKRSFLHLLALAKKAGAAQRREEKISFGCMIVGLVAGIVLILTGKTQFLSLWIGLFQILRAVCFFFFGRSAFNKK